MEKRYSLYDMNNNLLKAGLTLSQGYASVDGSDTAVKLIDPHTGTRVTDSDTWHYGEH